MDKSSCVRCSICFNYFSKPICLNCGHCFCKQCVDDLHKNECPICSSKIENISYPIVRCLQFQDDLETYDNQINELKTKIEQMEKLVNKNIQYSLRYHDELLKREQYKLNNEKIRL